MFHICIELLQICTTIDCPFESMLYDKPISCYYDMLTKSNFKCLGAVYRDRVYIGDSNRLNSNTFPAFEIVLAAYNGPMKIPGTNLGNLSYPR